MKEQSGTVSLDCSCQILEFNYKNMMASEPSLAHQGHSDTSLPRRKRRFKIFQDRGKESTEKQQTASHSVNQSTRSKLEDKEVVQNKGIHTGFIKIQRKQDLGQQFFGEDDCEIVLLEPNLNGYNTIASEKFGVTDQFQRSVIQPSVILKNNSLVINEASNLFQSVSQLKDSFRGITDEGGALMESVSRLNKSIEGLLGETESEQAKLIELEEFLVRMREQTKNYEKRMQTLDDQIEELQLRKQLNSREFNSKEQSGQLQEFVKSKVVEKQSEDSDYFAQTQIVPAAMLAQFIEMRKARAKVQLKSSVRLKRQKWAANHLQQFHKCFDISADKCIRLAQFIAEEFPNKQIDDLKINLVFRRSTRDLDFDWIGDKNSLEYQQCLLFVLRNSLGKCIGGFVSNYLIQQELREDPRAFLFSMEGECSKFKVREESQASAYEVSKHYMVCFGNDLMIASECLQEQSYCEWPNSYESFEGKNSSAWFAGDFSFMIEHIEVYQVTFD